MTNFRAEYDVSSSLALPKDAEPMRLFSKEDCVEIFLENADLDQYGHVSGLKAKVISECSDIKDAPMLFRELLARQLDILSFVTHSSFIIKQCTRVVEWESYKKSRVMIMLKDFDPLYPPDLELAQNYALTSNGISSEVLPRHTVRALQCFRLGLLSDHREEQFQHFWLTLENIAEGQKAPNPVQILCPKCKSDLYCKECKSHPTRRPMATEAIKVIVSSIVNNNADDIFKRMIRARNYLLHGGRPSQVEKEIKYPFEGLIDETATIAWHAIARTVLKSEKETYLSNRGWSFANLKYTVYPSILFDCPDGLEHPEDKDIPTVGIELITSFRPISTI